MISKYVNPGDRVDIENIKRKSLNDDSERRTFKSSIYDIIDEDNIKITMPIEQGKIVLFSVDAELNLCFYTKNGLYQCIGRVTDRSKDNAVYLLDIELVTDLKRYQRREYYRLNCVLDMKSTMINESDIVEYTEQVRFLDTDITFDNGTMVDISGGGARFISAAKYPKGSNILFVFSLFVNGALTEYKLVGKVLLSEEKEKLEGKYEHRIQFINIMNDDRESIIKYIFEEERRIRRREKGM